MSKAIAFYKASGKEIALAEFTNPKGPFIQDEMYIFVLDPKGIMIAHGVNEKYIRGVMQGTPWANSSITKRQKEALT